MKVILIHPHWIESYGKYKSAAKQAVFYPPLGLMYIGTILKQNGHEVKLIDSEAECKTTGDIINIVKEFDPDIVGITSTSPIYYKAKELAEKIKKIKNIPIVIGGAHVCVMQEQILKECPYFDFVIFGEGEYTMLELVNNLKKRNFKEIKGLIYRDKDTIIKNPIRSFIENLDDLPIPDRSLINNEKYKWSVPKKGFIKTTSLQTSRGCPFQCIFCSQRNVFGRTIRFRSVDNVIKELKEIIQLYNINHLVFLDDTLTLDKHRMMDICNKIIENKFNITWEGGTRANLVDEELLKKMKEAGLVRISFGIEAGNSNVLKVIKKGVTLEEMKNAYKLAKKVGLETRGSVIIGHPTETKKEVMETLWFIRKLKDCDQMYINIATPFPGTELYNIAVNGLCGVKLLSNDFSEYKRYGGPVIEVNDLKQKDLIRLQKLGYIMFYFTPKRIYYNIKRAGIKAGIKNAIAFAKSVFK